MSTFAKLFEEKSRKRNQNHQKEKQTKDTLVDGKGSFEHDKATTTTTSTSTTTGSKNKTSRRQKKPNQGRRNETHRKRKRLSQEALDLSSTLKDLSRQKRIDEALKLYWECSPQDRDEYHACILIDCCAKCGNVNEAEKVLQNAASVNVEMQTALLNVYGQTACMKKAHDLFTKMIQEARNKRMRMPNIRSLNTVLRGCLRTAAFSSTNEPFKVYGGVITSEDAWQLYISAHLDENPSFQTADTPVKSLYQAGLLDSSAYEYSISLLCQALRVDEAVRRIQEYQLIHNISIKGKAKFIIGKNARDRQQESQRNIDDADASTLETLATIYLSLAKAHAFLGKPGEVWIACQRVLNATTRSMALRTTNNNDKSTNDQITATTDKPSKKRKVIDPRTRGGKRSWKNGGSNKNEDSGVSANSARRVESNHAFRQHRLKELETEARTLLKSLGGKEIPPLSPKDVKGFLLKRLFLFSCTHGHGLNGSIKACRLSSWYSFGGSNFVASRKEWESAKGKVLNSDGTMNFKSIFESNPSGPIVVELGAGFGDWIVDRAQQEVKSNHVAVELRADRVFQILSKTLTLAPRKPLENVCIVGSDSGSFLSTRVKSPVISSIFAFHPEPPTQTFGNRWDVLSQIMSGVDAAEPLHMLTSDTLLAAAKCLLPGSGKIVIVTDNKWYAKLLGATFVRVHCVSSDLVRPPTKAEVSADGLAVFEKVRDNVCIYQKNTQRSVRGGSWFDRLWQTGAGTHAEKEARFVLTMYRV